MSSSAADTIDVKLAFKGRSVKLSGISNATTIGKLHENALNELGLSGDEVTLKLLHKGKILNVRDCVDAPAFPQMRKVGKAVKIIAMATERNEVSNLNSRRSDPLLRGFDDEKTRDREKKVSHWGTGVGQHRDYKFVRLEACTGQSFGHRAGSKTPHAFRAADLLERLATDPGIVAVMVERELVVNTLGEMDPIDDRLMQKKKTEGACLLGYNTNHGLRIDVKLRTDDLDGFLPYEDLASTLLHELSHNWVGEHNSLFWSNYGQMRVEYLHKHAALTSAGVYVNGRTTAALAGVAEGCRDGMKSISKFVLEEIAKEISPHGVPLNMVAPAVMQRCKELQGNGVHRGEKLAQESSSGNDKAVEKKGTIRQRTLAAAEQRARETKEKQEKERKDT